MPQTGQILSGTYQIIDEIGKGGAGIIYRAYHMNLQKYVVVKKIKDDFVGVLNSRGEVDILKSLHHTNLPQVYDFIQVGNEIYTVMDYIDGHDLKYYIDAHYFFTEDILWNWLWQLCDVLDYLHKHGILHLDIKPANIMITNEWNICLIDFNISLSKESEDISGISPYYAAPEQVQKWQGILYQNNNRFITLDNRTDIYSLGATFYHMMSGCRPSTDLNNLAPLSHFSISYSPELIGIIQKMMEPEPGKRYSGAEKIMGAVRRLQRTKAEKITLGAVFGIMFLVVVILASAIGITVYRGTGYVSKEERIAIQEKEVQLSEWNRSGNFEQAYIEGITFLNQEEEALDKLEGAKKKILAQIVDACLGREDYENARRYNQELLNAEPSAKNYSDAAVIDAYMGDFAGAEEFIEKAESAGGDTYELEKTKAELYAAKGEYQKAISSYEQLLLNESKTSLYRRVAYLSLKAAQKDDLSLTEKAEYRSKAISYYSRMYEKGEAAYADLRNLIVAYDQEKNLEKQISLLGELCINYPDEYENYRDYAIVRYQIQMKKAPAQRDFSQVKAYAQKAERLYKNNQYGNDETLSQLLDLVEKIP